jgi:hypothetical protein
MYCQLADCRGTFQWCCDIPPNANLPTGILPKKIQNFLQALLLMSLMANALYSHPKIYMSTRNTLTFDQWSFGLLPFGRSAQHQIHKPHKQLDANFLYP